MMLKNTNLKNYLFLLIISFLNSCNNSLPVFGSNPVFRLELIKNIDSDKNQYTITLYNNSTQNQEVYYNFDKLSFSCCRSQNRNKQTEVYTSKDLLKSFYNQEFVIENEHGDFRNFSDYQIIFKDKRIEESLNFEFILHCSDQIQKILPPKSSSVAVKQIILDKRLLRVLKDDKKVRLHYIYKDEKNVHILSSEWVNTK